MAALLFETQLCTRLHDIDAAGVVFYARYFYFAHNTYEDWLNSRHSNISSLLDSGCILPIIHTEADFKAPIGLNESIVLRLFLAEKKEHSFALEYQFYNHQDELKAVLQTVHVCLNSKNRKKVTLPAKLFD